MHQPNFVDQCIILYLIFHFRFVFIAILVLQIDDWLLYESAAVQMHNSRSLCHGRLWTEDGKLVATVAQEGVIRGKL